MQQAIADEEGSRNCQKNISVKEMISNENCFWNRRPDGIVIKKEPNTIVVYILEFKHLSDRNEDFLGAKEDEADEQYKSIIEALKAPALERNI